MVQPVGPACVEGRDVFDEISITTAAEWEAFVDIDDGYPTCEHPLPELEQPDIGTVYALCA
jgi:hypothetical protein